MTVLSFVCSRRLSTRSTARASQEAFHFGPHCASTLGAILDNRQDVGTGSSGWVEARTRCFGNVPASAPGLTPYGSLYPSPQLCDHVEDQEKSVSARLGQARTIPPVAITCPPTGSERL